jgi:hypothetical protein
MTIRDQVAEIAALAKHAPHQIDPRELRPLMLAVEERLDLLAAIASSGFIRISRPAGPDDGDSIAISVDFEVGADAYRTLLEVMGE